MLTFTSLGGSTLKCLGGGKPLVIFPGKKTEKSAWKDAVALLSAPEEEPAKGTISWPGEYNIADVSLKGIGQNEGQQVSFVAEVDGVRCAFLSGPLQDWTDHQLETVGEIDLLVLPQGDVKLVQKLVDEFDPRVLVLVPDENEKLEAEVLRACGAQGKERVSEYKLKGSLPAEGREIVVMAA